MKILAEEDLFALRVGQGPHLFERRIEQCTFEGPAGPLPAVRKGVRPPRGLLGQREERWPGRLPQPWQEFDDDVERGILFELGERGARLAELEQESVPLRVVGEQPDGAFSIPAGEGCGLVLALAIGKLDLEDGGATVRQPNGECKRRVGGREGLAQPQ